MDRELIRGVSWVLGFATTVPCVNLILGLGLWTGHDFIKGSWRDYCIALTIIVGVWEVGYMTALRRYRPESDPVVK